MRAPPSSETFVIDRLTTGSRMSCSAAPAPKPWRERALRRHARRRSAAGERVGIVADLAAVGFDEALGERGVADFVPGLARDGHDQRLGDGPLLPLDDLAAEGVDARELGAGDAGDERLAQLDVVGRMAHHLAHGDEILVEVRVADLLIELGLFFVGEVGGRAIGGLAD